MKPVNLLPQDAAPRAATGERAGSAYVIVGVLGALLLMVVGYVAGLQPGDHEDQRRRTPPSAKADALEPQAAQQDAFTDFAQIKQPAPR